MFSKFLRPIMNFVSMVASAPMQERMYMHYLAARLPETLQNELLSKKL